VALPVAIVEELLRRHQLHIEDVQCLDERSHNRLQRLLKKSLLLRPETSEG